MIPLSPSDEHDLIRRYQAGAGTTPDARRAGDALLRAYDNFIASCARRHMRRTRDNESIMQEARFGFLKALAAFDFDAGVKLSTYASWKIRGTISDWLDNLESLIRVPAHHQFKTPDGCTKREEMAIAAAMVLRSNAFDSLDRQVDIGSSESQGDTVRFGASLSDDGENSEELVAELYRQARMEVIIATTLAPMMPRTRDIMRARHLEDEQQDFTVIAGALGRTRQRAQQLELGAIAKMKRMLKPELWKTRGFEAWIEEVIPVWRGRAA